MTEAHAGAGVGPRSGSGIAPAATRAEPALPRLGAGYSVAGPMPARGIDQARSDFLLHRLYGIGDLIAISLAAVAAAAVALLGSREVDLLYYGVTLAVTLPFWFLIAYCAGLYTDFSLQIDQSFVDQAGKIATVATFWCWGFVLARSVFVVGVTDLLTPALLWMFMMVFLLFARAQVRSFARRKSWNVRSVATLGDPQGVAALSRRIDRHSEWGLRVRVEVALADGGFLTRNDHFSGEGEWAPWSLPPDPVGGTGARTQTQQLVDVLEKSNIDRVLIAGGLQDLVARSELIRELVDSGITVDHISGGPETLYSAAHLQHLEGMTVMTVAATGRRPFAMFLKRALDVTVALFGLLAAAPVLALSALAIKLDSRGPVFFRQAREGKDGETFQVLKLRTMADGADLEREALKERSIHGADSGMLKLKEDPRVTRIGRRLRNSSIDELPQLWNVLTGEMSLVGPRPLPLDEACQIDSTYSARQRVRPGITGPWQVMGRSEIPMEDMIKLDYTYVVGWSLAEDVRILLKTASAVTGRKGVY